MREFRGWNENNIVTYCGFHQYLVSTDSLTDTLLTSGDKLGKEQIEGSTRVRLAWLRYTEGGQPL